MFSWRGVYTTKLLVQNKNEGINLIRNYQHYTNDHNSVRYSQGKA